MPRRTNKALGQHFLKRGESCAPLIDFLAPADRWTLEIGPGAGALTRALLDSGARVLGWEVDPAWAIEVRRRLRSQQLTIVVGDALELPWSRLPLGSLVAGNLPYNIGTRLILDCLEASRSSPGRIDRAGFLVQLEVAERLVAGPGDAAYGSLSVLVAAMAEARVLGRIGPGAFEPPPKVDSAFVGLRPRGHPELVSEARYRQFKLLVRAAFAHRRKTLRNSLSAAIGRDSAVELLEASGLGGLVRAEELGIDDFVALLSYWERLRPESE